MDILFANESEICSLYPGDGFEDAIEDVRSHCETAVLTRSEQGSVIVTATETVRVPAHPTEVVDTTGAGDLYAALGERMREQIHALSMRTLTPQEWAVSQS